MDRGFSQKITKKLLPGKNTGKYIIAAAAAVLLLVLFSDFLFPEKTESDYISQLEEKLETVLSETKGVGPCEVVITAVGGNEYVYATEKTDKSKSSVSGEKTQTDTDIKTNVKTVTEQRSEKPLVEKEIYPEIQGAVIICKGGGSGKIRAEVTEIASTLLGISSDKIVVGEKK